LARGGSSIVGRGLAGYNHPERNQQRCCHHATMLKPEAANAVVSL